MGVALKRLELIDGRTKEEAEKALMVIAGQLEGLDDLVKIRTDHEVWKLFQKQQQEIQQAEKAVLQLLQNK